MNKRIEKAMKELQKNIDKSQKKHIKKIIKKNKYHYQQLDKDLQQLFKQYEAEGKINYSQLVYDGKQIEMDYKIALNVISYYAEVMKEADKALSDVIKATLQSINNLDGIPSIKKDIPVSHIINKEMAGLKWTQRLEGGRDLAIKTIQQTIRDGLEQGKLYGQMSTELARQFGTELTKAERIVRTESHRVLNDTKLQSFQEINRTIPIMKKWVSMSDERVREGHQDLDGTIIPLTENFISPLGGVGQGPGLMNNAADDIHCRCIMIMVI